MSTKILKIDPVRPQPDVIAEAAQIIQKGGIVMFPTRCLYGLAADALNREAIDRVFAIKRRPADKPLSIMVSQISELAEYVKSVPANGYRIMTRFWPGGVTIVLEARNVLPANLTAQTGTIGVRVPGHPVAAALTKAAKRPMTATSANITGAGGCAQIGDLDSELAAQLDLILDSGPLEPGIGSTVVNVSADSVTILREGRFAASDILAVLS